MAGGGGESNTCNLLDLETIRFLYKPVTTEHVCAGVASSGCDGVDGVDDVGGLVPGLVPGPRTILSSVCQSVLLGSVRDREESRRIIGRLLVLGLPSD